MNNPSKMFGLFSVSAFADNGMSAFPTTKILGIRFFHGAAAEAVDRMQANGGLLVAPSGTCFQRFVEDGSYRRAILGADVVLADSGFMVLLARVLRGLHVRRISGLAYLQTFLGARSEEDGARSGESTEPSDMPSRVPTSKLQAPCSSLSDVFWILPNENSRGKLDAWLRSRSGERGGERANADKLTVEKLKSVERTYVAPIYGSDVVDQELLALINQLQPRNVVIGIGAGPQEKLGHYLRENASYRPAIHCIGGALGFITGDQVAIPGWADRLYLGWLLRLLSQPKVFIPRLARGRVLPWLIWRYGDRLPPLRKS